MRGKDFHRSGSQTSDRITPAWAGKSSSGRGLRWGCRDHPHTGGEKGTLPLLVCWWAGSPLRGRGKDLCFQINHLHEGITPAWAGKSPSLDSRKSPGRDHPRVGGEKGTQGLKGQAWEGSPPRGRGKVIHHRCAGRCGRITPARAGKSPASQPWSPPLWMMVIRPRP